ncbi:MAG: RNA polymerase sigma factor [Candidatus Kapaibacterium sp.]
MADFRTFDGMDIDFSSTTDTELYGFLREAKSTRDAAFTEIYERYSTRIYLYCRKILGSGEVADDAFQETFSLFLKSADVSREMTNLPAYLLRIARNVCLQMMQKVKRRPESVFEDGFFRTESEMMPVERAELIGLLEVALEVLPDEQREALILQVYDEMSYQEIADFMGVPLTTVRNWVVRAKKRLRDELQQYWADYRA